MSQFSVPSSITDQFSQDGDGVGNNGAISFAGAATAWQAVSNPAESSYATIETSTVIIPPLDYPQAYFDFGMQPVNDPLINTGHTLRIVFRGAIVNDEIGPDIITWNFLFSFIQAGISIPYSSIEVPVNFTEFVIPLSEAEVIAFRLNGGYAGSTVEIFASINAIGTPGNTVISSLLIDVAFIQLEVPDADFDMAIIGNLHINAELDSLVSPESIIGDLSLEVELDSLIADNYIVGDLQANAGIDSPFSDINSIIGDLSLEGEFYPITVYSADASGLYKLVPGKTNDTLYQREDVEDTIDVAIPEPVVRTAYLGG